MTESLREAADVVLLVGQDEGDRGAGTACPARAADAVHVVVIEVGRVEVDHVTDVVDVEPAGGDVGGDERRRRARTRTGRARARADSATCSRAGSPRRDVALAELAGERVGAVLRADEDERELLDRLQLLDEPIELVLGRDGDECVLDLLPRGRLPAARPGSVTR